MGTADPMLSATLEGRETHFLVDTGASHSTLNFVSPLSLTSQTVSLTGFSRTEQSLPFTKPLTFTLGNQHLQHSFVSSPTTPVNLLGRDLLIKLGATIMCSVNGLIVSFPDGTSLPCANFHTDGQFLIQPVVSEYADIYWGPFNELTLQPSNVNVCGLETLAPVSALLRLSSGSPHVTLFYDRDVSEWYQEPFLSTLEETTWEVKISDIHVAPVGVAAAVSFTETQSECYQISDEAVPHISLCLHPEHQAKELGPMMKRSLAATDWIATAVPDVGLASCSPNSFQVDSERPLWIPQYPHKPAAEQGIAETITGLIEAGVLEPSKSDWNTPILPVEKKGTGKYRMAHDLRAVNAVLKTKIVPVPNPYVSIAALTPSQQWYSCIDLANAFFCVPLAESCRDYFSFTFRGEQWRYTRLPQGFALSPGLFNQVLKDVLQDCPLPRHTTLIQYVDDLLLAAPTAELCVKATSLVLAHLHQKGFKVSKNQLQIARK
ncbi:uncharacterized protein LOC111612296 isoform X1 [Xiphophorus maculatus]|uniref:uncharacterized protein LOC111606204 isoform X1 n=1 Tax=Xiphophorus maculatus TaxID=8083 RepID=UPI000C6EC3CB|nr:uncharacterized protein LOC111606204 isoform X1 [Xiphophorus maculatus]XP_023209064.1 uncharacterized protein LOC111612296 isoform X1 [Xiphophorus maculatus]